MVVPKKRIEMKEYGVPRPEIAVVPMLACLMVCAFAGSLTGSPLQQQGANVRLVRAAGGPRGSAVGGRFVFEEERSTFTRSRDTQVVVAFEWEGSPGKRRLSATWRHLDTASSSTSEIEYDARDPRFGVYWTFPLTASTPLGKWRLDAAVDGLPAGMFEFEVVDAAPATAVPSRRILSPAELYQHANSALVIVERLNATGGVVDVNAGLVLGDDLIATAFSAIDASHAVRLTVPKGTRLGLTALVGWNRQHDWALVGGTSFGSALLKHAAAPPAVGDRCYSIETGGQGGRILAEGSIVGQQPEGKAGPRPLAVFVIGVASLGAPVLNDAGEVLGIVGSATSGSGFGESPRVFRLRAETPGVPIVPIAIIREFASRNQTPVADLVMRGVLTTPVDRARGQNILSAGFAPRVKKDGPATQPIDQRYEFSQADVTMVVFVTWNPQERLRGLLAMRIHDEVNRTVGESQGKKVDLRVGRTIFTDWTIAVPSAAGVYRVDVLLDGRPIWRDFFRVTGQ